MSTEQSFDRAGAVALFFTLVQRVSPELAVRGAAIHYSVCIDAINRALTAAAVRQYLHALGLTHEPALEVLIAAARKFHIPTEALQSAVDEHLLSVEAL